MLSMPPAAFGSSSISLCALSSGLSGFQFIATAENQRTGLKEIKHLEASLPGKKTVVLPLPVSLQHAGRYILSAQSERGTDPLHLFRKKMPADTELALTVYPQEVPLHITRFFPRFRMRDRTATDVRTVYRLADVARENLKYVYTGNC